jgi:hypothetical protein
VEKTSILFVENQEFRETPKNTSGQFHMKDLNKFYSREGGNVLL